ncbi:hypothetical protein Scep_008736 [Stephania cephalantha]|uniref:Uncharacterized protein n=1 Tax=Stephania cephalantha TaxID=152367 RepID=A0AAP0JSR3_9MAGN
MMQHFEGLACKEINVGGYRGWRLRVLEALIIILAFTQTLYLLLIHAGVFSSKYGPAYRDSDYGVGAGVGAGAGDPALKGGVGAGARVSCTWNYATNACGQCNSTDIAIEEGVLKGRKCANTEKLAPGRMSLARQISDGIEWDFSTGNVPAQVMGYDHQRETASNKDSKIGVESSDLIKALGDYILSNSKETSTKGLPRSTQNI